MSFYNLTLPNQLNLTIVITVETAWSIKHRSNLTDNIYIENKVLEHRVLYMSQNAVLRRFHHTHKKKTGSGNQEAILEYIIYRMMFVKNEIEFLDEGRD